MRALYLSHPQVEVDSEVPVPLWRLSSLGRQRAEAFARSGIVPRGALIFSSGERKAVELAELLAQHTGSAVWSDHRMGENDRSATGFLPPALFEETANRFFAEPERSIDGWERAVDAQERIVSAVRAVTATLPDGTAAVFCGHGAVGTLLKCHVANRPIARSQDQRFMADPGGGNGYVFDLAAGQLLCDWTPLEDLRAGWFTSGAS